MKVELSIYMRLVAILFFLVNLTLLGSPSVSAQNSSPGTPYREGELSELISTPNSMRFGLEVEFTQSSLRQFLRHIDLNYFKNSNKKRRVKIHGDELEAIFNPYLKDGGQSALESLPIGIQRILTRGFDLESPTLIYANSTAKHALDGATEINPSGSNIFVPGQKIKSNPSRVKIPSPRMPIGQSKVISPSSIYSPKSQDSKIKDKNFEFRKNWNIVLKRWSELPLNQKVLFSDWNLLTGKSKAKIFLPNLNSHFLSLPDGANGIPTSPLLRPDAPEEIRALFDKLEVGPDGAAVEFRYQTKRSDGSKLIVSNPDEVFKDFYTFGKFGSPAMTRTLSDPEDELMKKVQWGSIHLHISSQGKDLKAIAVLINKLIMVLRVKQGIISDLKGEGRYLFQKNLNERGLVRIISDDHIELRNFPIALVDILRAVIPAIDLPEREAIAGLKSQINELLDEKTIGLMLEYGGSKFFGEIVELLESEEIKNSPSVARFVKEREVKLLKFLSHYPESPLTKEEKEMIASGDTKFILALLNVHQRRSEPMDRSTKTELRNGLANLTWSPDSLSILKKLNEVATISTVANLFFRKLMDSGYYARPWLEGLSPLERSNFLKVQVGIGKKLFGFHGSKSVLDNWSFEELEESFFIPENTWRVLTAIFSDQFKQSPSLLTNSFGNRFIRLVKNNPTVPNFVLSQLREAMGNRFNQIFVDIRSSVQSSPYISIERGPPSCHGVFDQFGE